MRPAPLHAPDGFTSGRHDDAAARIPPGAMPAQDRQDDGLVHGHAWACSAARAPGPRRNTWSLPLVMLERGYGDHHDDGLVHNHGWAVTAR